ncbi:hypothetical protein ACH5RR_031001 [Cinchona calisaya]|uniref:UBC core domain-containing protein n=1 Tax=Cinchona calisaya TaxID=153742 RepID=A0ABD2YDX5_9GENT
MTTQRAAPQAVEKKRRWTSLSKLSDFNPMFLGESVMTYIAKNESARIYSSLLILQLINLLLLAYEYIRFGFRSHQPANVSRDDGVRLYDCLHGENEVAANTFEFPHFEICSDESAHSDHYYITSNKSKKIQDYINHPSKAVSKQIAKEWKILEKDLPESIYVRVYEQRIDLIRAVIIGASGTPYHDGLFFFDIVLPSDYPNHPPQVYYHSHGLRLNPNLYGSGTVCLSLIRTWSGNGVELWRPSKSTILQLLVSLQGLVLNAKPYFNEPGREVGLKSTSATWIKRSMAYNEEVFILSCKTMLYNLQKPPTGFHNFIVEHFRNHGDFILAAIRAYRNGEAVVGQYQEVGSVPSTPVHVPAKSFRKHLEKIHSDLKLAFIKIDTDPPRMRNLELEKAKTSESSGDESNRGLACKIFDALKWMFDFE